MEKLKTVNMKNQKSHSKDNLHNNGKNLIRLNRYLAMSGIGSRRNCDTYILEGRVSVNEETVAKLGTRVNPKKDKVCFDGNLVEKVQNLIYILLNKPLRTVSTANDDRKRRTVIDIIGAPNRLFPVGRLDYNTTGALLITNDGELSYFLLHPRFEVKKSYRAILNKIIRPVDLHHFQNGIMLDDRKTSPCKARELRRAGNRSYLEVELHEGRNRQIRRMFEALGYHVEELHRANFAGLQISDLNPGEWRELTIKEINSLKKLVDEQKENILQSAK